MFDYPCHFPLLVMSDSFWLLLFKGIHPYFFHIYFNLFIFLFFLPCVRSLNSKPRSFKAVLLYPRFPLPPVLTALASLAFVMFLKHPRTFWLQGLCTCHSYYSNILPLWFVPSLMPDFVLYATVCPLARGNLFNLFPRVRVRVSSRS